MKNKKHKKIVHAALAGLFAAGSVATMTFSQSAHAKEDVKCYGINACKGSGECGGANAACAGSNACKGSGWVHVASSEECTKKGGHLTETALNEAKQKGQAKAQEVQNEAAKLKSDNADKAKTKMKANKDKGAQKVKKDVDASIQKGQESIQDAGQAVKEGANEASKQINEKANEAAGKIKKM